MQDVSKQIYYFKDLKVKAYLYPNPPFEGETLTDIWGTDYHMRNEPFLEVVINGLSLGNYTVELISPVRLQQSFEGASSHKTLFFIHPTFADPAFEELSIRVRKGANSQEFILPLAIHKLTGQVRDFDNHPFPAYVWAVSESPNSPQAIVRTNEEGRFTLWYPEGKPLRIFIDDGSYARTTYECWITAEELKGDVRLDPRVGNFELWGLHTWRTQLSRQIYFWPCSLPLDLRAKRSGWKLPRSPRLAKGDITVHINGEEVPIKGLHRVRVWAGGEKGYPIYLLELSPPERDPCSPELIQVEVHTKARGRGEAWYIAW